MIDNQTNVHTSVQQVDLDLDSLFDGAPAASNIVTPTNAPTEIKPNIFSKKQINLDFLDAEEEKSSNDGKTFNSTTNNVEVKREIQDALNEILDEGVVEDDENFSTKKGRPRTEKSGLVEFLKKRIEGNEMFAFDDYDENKQSLDDYLSGLGEKDIEDLWQANITNLKEEVAAQTPAEFFQSLPEELQYAAKYVADGGQDLKVFSALAQDASERLDPTDAYDQEHIVRSYLQATNFGTSDEIDEELTTWKDIGALEKKAKQFKPKLDQMQEQIVIAQLQEQEYRKQQQQVAADTYQKNVFEALRPAEINGLKLDKVQAQLYSGLVQPQYPSISGKPTNLLGHLLERYQFIEPNYPLIAEALWLLSNPEDYRQNLVRQGKNQAVEQTVRQLKTEQSRKNVSTYYEEEEQQKSRKIAKPQNIFKR